jgi:hypothetical protein
MAVDGLMEPHLKLESHVHVTDVSMVLSQSCALFARDVQVVGESERNTTNENIANAL